MALQHQYDDDESETLRIHLVPELRRRIKQAVEKSNMSVQEYVENFLEQTLPSEPIPIQNHRKGLNRAAIDTLLRHREEWKRTHPGEVIKDSSELLYEAREERMKELEGE